MAPATNATRLFAALIGLTGVLVLTTLYWAFFRAPFEAVMGAAQKIFYFHVPAAYAMYLSATTCFVASALYLNRPSDRADAVARAGAEAAVAFGAIVLTTGPIWARPIWGVYWEWEPRLLTSLLSVMIYVSYVVLRAFAGDGSAERQFAAALGLLGATVLPIIHYSVQKWGGNHPRVISSGGGGLGHPDMKLALTLGFASYTSLAVALIWSRARLHTAAARLSRAEEDALEAGLLEEDEALETTVMTSFHTALDPQKPMPAETPQTAFGAGIADQDPMRNFGYTVAAYAVLWAILLAFVFFTWRRQMALEARLGRLERSIAKPPAGGG